MTAIGRLEVSPLCFGGNVFGWTLDERESFAVLDAFAAAGGDFIDTSDAYPPPPSGLPPGRSEEIIGAWMAARGNREEIVIATKVGSRKGGEGLSPAQIREGAEGSLRRLRTDRIDLYYAHNDDRTTALEETLGAFDALVRAGKVREVGASNYGAERLAAALAVARREGFARFAALQPHYNLVERDYEREQRDLCAREGIACVPYFGLASGFLTGKYRPGHVGEEDANARARRAAGYLEEERGPRILEALDRVAEAHGASVASVALAWLAAQPTVAAPIASARGKEQLDELLAFTALRLGEEDLRRLDEASRR